jgi:hypothetical protein
MKVQRSAWDRGSENTLTSALALPCNSLVATMPPDCQRGLPMSKYVDWSHDLSVGVKEIDEQHMKLIDLVNEMHEAITEHRASEVTMRILNELIVYTQTHFQTEDALMNILEYEDFEVDTALHDAS